MPYIRLQEGFQLYGELEGEGPPLLLLEGKGYALWMWEELRPLLSASFRLILYDHRGIGRSERGPLPFSLKDLARDGIQVLDALGVERAHVLGVSMGGMVAQEMALSYPSRVEKLILACTHPGGSCAYPTPPETIAHLSFSPEGLSLEEILRRQMEVAFAPVWTAAHPEAFSRWIARRKGWVPPSEVLRAQDEAIAGFDACRRLPSLKAPTLILSGTEDRVVPYRNSQLLAQAIPGARLQLFPGGGHLFFLEEGPQFAKAIKEFLREEA
ncbi:MAG: alpha/beta fold hydrolase [Bacillota bacterium]|nr:alpha/beta fold hydrolase [Bacillota bacterium]